MKLLLLIICMTSILTANLINITGNYKGYAKIENNNLHIKIKNIKTESLSYYKDMYATTGGNRIALYFDIDGKQGAELCGFIYKKTMIFKRISTPGFFNITVDWFPLVNLKNNVTSIVIPMEYFSNKPLRIWN